MSVEIDIAIEVRDIAAINCLAHGRVIDQLTIESARMAQLPASAAATKLKARLDFQIQMLKRAQRNDVMMRDEAQLLALALTPQGSAPPPAMPDPPQEGPIVWSTDSW